MAPTSWSRSRTCAAVSPDRASPGPLGSLLACGFMDLEPAKRAAGEAAALMVEDGMTLGLGTGTTARWFIEAVGARVADGLRVPAGAPPRAGAAPAPRRGIPLLELEAAGVDLAVDGADPVA